MQPRTRPLKLTSTLTAFSAPAFALALGMAACGSDDDTAASMTPETPAANVTCPTRGALGTPAVPASIVPPSGGQPYLRVYAEGSQIYTCEASASGAPAWTFKAPEAKLYDDRCVLVGSHFAGPTWKIERDGSAVVGKKTAEMAGEAPGSIPWLLLAASTSTGSGMLTGTQYINRVDTVGGVAPASGCDAATLGQELKVPYTATYLYYR
jgi:hypothetical protein